MPKKFSIPGKALSLNKTLSLHWANRAKAVKRWKLLVAVFCGIKVQPVTWPVSVKFTIYLNRFLDSDNLQGGSMKAIRDGLKVAGWMKDDSPLWASFEYEQVKCPKGQEHILVEIKNAE